MRKAAILAGLVMLTLAAPIQARTGWTGSGFTVVPFEFDPHGTHLVAAQWKGGKAPLKRVYGPVPATGLQHRRFGNRDLSGLQ